MRVININNANKELKKKGFTLLELLVALMLLVIAMTIIVTTFTVSVTAWQKGSEALDSLHNSELVIEQVVSSLRSAVFFNTKSELYGFWLKSEGGSECPADQISWVSSGSALLQEKSELSFILHRVILKIKKDDDGEMGLTVKVFMPMADREHQDKEEEVFISKDIKGLSCSIYDKAMDSWKDSWDDTNSLPKKIELIFYVKSVEGRSSARSLIKRREKGELVKVYRLINIPLGNNE